MIKDVYKQPFITVGFTAFPLMIPLAVTGIEAPNHASQTRELAL